MKTTQIVRWSLFAVAVLIGFVAFLYVIGEPVNGMSMYKFVLIKMVACFVAYIAIIAGKILCNDRLFREFTNAIKF